MWMRKDDISWGDEGCNRVAPRVALLIVFAMLLNLRSMWRYVRHGEMP